jgi:GH24 family phage-related lysozyme (muramidase)
MKYNIKKFQNGGIPSPLKAAMFDITAKPKSDITFDKNYMIQIPDYGNTQLIEDTMPLIKQFEKFKPNIYKDGKGKLTIGYGETRPEYIKKKTITEPQAAEASKDYMSKNVLPALQNKPYYSALNPEQKVSLSDLIYNIGQTKFNNSPKLQDALKKHD